MDEADYLRIMVFVMLFLWIVYPLLVTKLRPKIFNVTNERNVHYANLFVFYCFIIGFSTTIGTFVILSLFNGDTVTFEGMIKGSIVGLISETIILFPDTLEKIFKINLKSSKSMMKFILIYLISFILLMELIEHFLL
jgi:hypothetical protein